MSEGTEQQQPKADLSTRVEELLGAIDAACADLEQRMKDEDESALDEISTNMSHVVSSDDGLIVIDDRDNLASSVVSLQSEVEDQVGSLLHSLEVASSPREEDAKAEDAQSSVVTKAPGVLDESLEEQGDAPSAEDLEASLSDIAKGLDHDELRVADEKKVPADSAADRLERDEVMAGDLDALDAELSSLAESMLEGLGENDEDSESEADTEASAWEMEVVASIDEARKQSESEGEEPEPALPDEADAALHVTHEPIGASAVAEVPLRHEPDVATISKAETMAPAIEVVPICSTTQSGPRERAFALQMTRAMKSLGDVAALILAHALLISAKPAEKLPDTLRQTLGWFAAYTAFLGVCVWAFVLVFREPNIPVAIEEPFGLYTETSAN